MHSLHQSLAADEGQSSANRTVVTTEPGAQQRLDGVAHVPPEYEEPSVQRAGHLQHPRDPETSSALPTTVRVAGQSHADEGDAVHELVSAEETASEKSVEGLLPWSQDALPLYRRLSRLQDRFFAISTQLGAERKDIRPELAHINKSLSYLELVMKPPQGSQNEVWDHSQRMDAYSQFVADRRSFEAKMKSIDHREYRLSNLEYKIAKLQRELLQILASYFTGEKPHDAGDTTSDSSYSFPPSPTPDPLAEHYELLREQVRQLQVRLAGLLTDAVWPPGDDSALPRPTEIGTCRDWSASDKDGWRNDYIALWNELHQVEERLVTVRYECQTAGLEVGDLHLETLDLTAIASHPIESGPPTAGDGEREGASFWPYDLRGNLPDFLRGLNWPRPGGLIYSIIASRSAQIARFAAKQKVIKDWVRTMPSDPVEFKPPSDAAEPADFDPVFSSPEHDPGWTYVDRTRADVAHSEGYVVVHYDDNIAPNGHAMETRYSEASAGATRQLRAVRSEPDLRPARWSVSTASNLFLGLLRRHSPILYDDPSE